MPTSRYFKKISLMVFCLILLSSCGYELVREKGIYGGDITSIHVPIFKNKTYEPHASMYVTDSFTRELVSSGLFQVNKADYDGYIIGEITNIEVTHATMGPTGVVVEKSILVYLNVSLFKKNGGFIKSWSLSDSEIYRVDDLNAEDNNKRDALKRASGRMARKFCSILLIDY